MPSTSFEAKVRESDGWFQQVFKDLESESVQVLGNSKALAKASDDGKNATAATAATTTSSNGANDAKGDGAGATFARVVLERQYAVTAKGGRKAFVPAPMTFLDGLASQKAKELKGEEKKRGGGHSRNSSLDLKKLKGKSVDGLANAASAAGISKDILQYAVNSLPQLSVAEEDDKRTVFWRIMDDHFRRVDKADLGAIKNFLRNPEDDPAFKIPPVGKKYRVQWQDEERIKMQMERASTSKTGPSHSAGGAGYQTPRGTASPAVKSKSKVSTGLPGRTTLPEKKLIPITSTLCPKPKGTTPEQMSELCDVCFDGESQEGNMIVFCDSCNVAVHQQCYGIPVVPEGQWLCNKCLVVKEKGLSEKQAPSCVLCPVRDGALKPANPKHCITCTGEPSKNQEFVHLFCSQWMPETFIAPEDTGKMEPVQNLRGISKDRFKLVCSICKQRKGACIQCSHGMCATAFHPLCARATGLLMEVVGYENSDDIDLKVYCSKHTKRPVKRSLGIPQTPKAKQVEATPTPKKVVKKEAQDIAKPQDKALSIDLLAELPPGVCAALLRQMCTLFGLALADVSKDSGVDANRISSFMYKKSALTEEESQKLLAWIRKHAATMLGDSAKVIEKKALLASPKKGGGGKPGNAAVASRHQINMLRGELPKCFRNELGEYMHVYTKLLLKSEVDATRPPATPPPSTEKASERKARASRELSYALACSPESETMGELFVMQHELAKQMLVNRRNLKSLVSKVRLELPEEAKRFTEREKDMEKVNKFLEATKEAKRLLKRERRAEQQKLNLAAAEAAVAQSTRHSAGRNVEDFYKPVEDVPAPVPNVYTKDSSGQEVIYDKYSIQKTDQDLLCSVCGQGHSEEPNQIVFCEMCDLAVHQRCYGVAQIPEGEWLCWPCKEYESACLKKGMPKSQIRKPRFQGSDFTAVDAVKCACCPVKRGAFKKTRQGEWVHVVCAMWNKVSIEDKNAADCIGSVKDCVQGSQSLTCSICNQKGGAIIKCNYGHCQTFFHPLCARAAGFIMPLRSGVGTGAMVRAYCGRHGHLVQQQPLPQQHQVPISPMLVEHIEWLETNLSRLRKARQELERLRLISDVLIKREKTKTSLLRAEQEYILKCLQRPKIAKDFEEKMQNPEYAQKVLSHADYNSQKRKAYYQAYEKTKYGRQHLQAHPMVERQRVMTVDQAKATNVKLPAGYLYVPLDFPKK